MRNFLQVGKLCWYVTSHAGQLSLDILSLVGGVNRHSVQYISPMFLVLQLEISTVLWVHMAGTRRTLLSLLNNRC